MFSLLFINIIYRYVKFAFDSVCSLFLLYFCSLQYCKYIFAPMSLGIICALYVCCLWSWLWTVLLFQVSIWISRLSRGLKDEFWIIIIINKINASFFHLIHYFHTLFYILGTFDIIALRFFPHSFHKLVALLIYRPSFPHGEPFEAFLFLT